MRTFVAISPPSQIQERLEAIQTHLRTHLADAALRWTRPTGIHLTLAFLGNVAPDKIESLAGGVRVVCKTHTPFELTLESLGAFPDLRRPRVLWVGLGGDLARLGSFRDAVGSATAGYGGHQETKAFHPHLTLARVSVHSRSPSSLPRAFTSAQCELVAPRWQIHAVHLYQSELGPAGAVYTSLAEVPLAGEAADAASQ